MGAPWGAPTCCCSMRAVRSPTVKFAAAAVVVVASGLLATTFSALEPSPPPAQAVEGPNREGAVPGQDDPVPPDQIPPPFPDASTTGVPADVSLRSSGPITVVDDGAVVDAMDVAGSITVRADNVTVQRSRVRTSGHRYGIKVEAGSTGTVVEDVEIEGTDDGCSIGIVYGDFVVRRANIHGCADGVRADSDATVEDSYIHDLRKFPGSHNDGVQSTGGSNIRLVGNNIVGPFQQSTSAILIHSNQRPVNEVLIEGNRLSGGTYTLYVRDKGTGHGPPSNVVVRNNVWVHDSWLNGPFALHEGPGLVWSGNLDDRGAPLS